MAGKSEYKNKFAAEKYDRISIMLPKGGKIVLKEAANQEAGGSVNKYVTNAINKQLQTDGFSPMQKQIAEPDRAEQAAEPMQEEEIET